MTLICQSKLVFMTLWRYNVQKQVPYAVRVCPRAGENAHGRMSEGEMSYTRSSQSCYTSCTAASCAHLVPYK